jgi:hypothetical protein
MLTGIAATGKVLANPTSKKSVAWLLEAKELLR